MTDLILQIVQGWKKQAWVTFVMWVLKLKCESEITLRFLAAEMMLGGKGNRYSFADDEAGGLT